MTAFMTAFYMFRLWFMTFSGKQGAAAVSSHGESPKSMTAPLVILALFAVAFGFMMMFGWEQVFAISLGADGWVVGGGTLAFSTEYLEELFNNYKTYITIALVIVAIILAYVLYSRKSVLPGIFSSNGRSSLYKVLSKRWYFPELYDQISWKLGYGIAKGVDFIDRDVIDGSVNGLANAVIGGGESIAKAQDGHVNSYAIMVIAGMIALFIVAALLLLEFEVIRWKDLFSCP